MSKAAVLDASRPDFDQVIQDITDYVMNYDVTQSQEAMETARYCWMDTIGCGLFALKYPACTKMLGPIVPGAGMDNGSRVPGTSYELDPVRAAWNIGAMVRWLDFNDTWLAAEWGHPSDNLGAILALADYQSRSRVAKGEAPLTMKDVLVAMVQAHEVQGVIALENCFNRVGLDHVMLVRIASAAVAARMLGCNRDEICTAVSHAWLDGSSLRTYRHAPNTGSRKSWAAGDASSRGLFLALMAQRGEMGYPSAITAKTWGFQDVSFKGNELVFNQPYETYVMENILFKISFPAEFHAQTAVEAAITLHDTMLSMDKTVDDIQTITLETQESGDRIINKTGKLDNPADRDHCLQYMVAVGLLKGRLNAEDYEDDVASDVRIDQLRDKMTVKENERFTREYLEADKRAIGNAIHITFTDGRTINESVDYPVGHRRRRDEGIPLLKEKFERYVRGRISQKNSEEILSICSTQESFEQLSVNDMMDLFVI
ncbi:MAG: bifunctional 2-methylcitrate dehydratase/aconitate hydratase [Gammaproteobacteria bacterium]|jgi:2-methylcitrate dehydratase|nr:bifunctional 2-methylcitrate dehydratase/aconitate hydratase [Gammaproteobacteria bacterium]MBT3725186.1 bifunctional 2-methylcitrate dehydratase/aconitate hydratase [Gammaproteobacteria bacterium]MBT4077184.1 bifunctional 2-methylcitrate dehydratase/aconitate hydratase [Gammaproteobacteria bacterium]MBT4196126.1 bifunctional 2-methylcitrate dehydratase/aconitate hydratase [Gammaproteobacteria bacterium]MBT4450482.1 bifunctional 2-methylcitrate dehydratase/aconitate hydratase [Gammaproteobac